MDLQPCLDALSAHIPFDADEADSLAATLTFLDQHPRFWPRDNYAGHLTASAWVVNADQSQVLLTHHKRFDRWLQLGGHLEAEDETLLAGALREAIEESGIQAIEPLQTSIFDLGHHPIPTAKEPSHVHYDIRFLLVAQDMKFTVSDESHALGWFDLEVVPTLDSSPALGRMAQKLLQRPSPRRVGLAHQP